MSFGNFIFFAAHFLCLLGVSRKEDLRRHLHTGLLPLQFLVWMGTLVAMFAIPSYVFDTYGQVRDRPACNTSTNRKLTKCLQLCEMNCHMRCALDGDVTCS